MLVVAGIGLGTLKMSAYRKAIVFSDSGIKVVGEVVIPPFLMGLSRRIQAAVFSFIAGGMPPMPMLGRSLL
ncbi:hypothetical protein DT23_12710 [Thioclava indica]|uniref:Uncharacterized protein n=2 Tax=Thioclava indica TaxID=1353528 RepID=A0A074KGN2_9RHOB|nr:hypothetical protein DT23_12710 [Thioclava indica]